VVKEAKVLRKDVVLGCREANRSGQRTTRKLEGF
jgi:hypothetical protein